MIRTLNITTKRFNRILPDEFTVQFVFPSPIYVSMVTGAIKRTQCIHTGSQTRKAIMDSIVTFIDICKNKMIFDSLI